ncbi:HNH/ENDO VII family nuclease [Kitasatospora kazusensis]
MSLIVPTASAEIVVGGYHYTGKVWPGDPLPKQPKVKGHAANSPGHTGSAPLQAGARPMAAHAAVAPQWPAASASTVDLTSSAAKSLGAGSRAASAAAAAGADLVRAGSSPVSVGAVPSQQMGAQARSMLSMVTPFTPPTSVKVQLADRAGAQAANVDGLLVGLTRADGQSSAGGLSVSLDYGSVAQAYGGAWASRLQLVAMPSCALTTPQLAQCRTQHPLDFTNDTAGHKLTTTVGLSAAQRTASAFAAPSAGTAALTSGVAVAAISGAGGSQGSYTATSLSPSGSWSQSSSGAFTYNYSITSPPSLGGNAPTVGLSYNSQSIDGETSGRNSQSSWIGDGWNYSPGFIERSFKPCTADGITGSGDECWAGYNATISLGSHTGRLVPEDTSAPGLGKSKVYHLLGDDGTKVEDLSGASNGLWNGEYFKVTTTDGTSYYLGANHAPNTTSDAATNSAWGVPVYHPNSGDPCYDSAKGSSSTCNQPVGYRFNLDFVVDPQGNVQRYDWAAETNWYNMGYGQVAASGGAGTLTSYTRGGYLTQISYGYQLADEAAGRDPAAQVLFNPDYPAAQRCTTSDTVCQSSNLSSSTAVNWPDVPYDLNCPSTDTTSGTGSSVCQVASPTFWSTVRLREITTRVKTSTGWQNVDSYALSQAFSDAGGTADPVTGQTGIDGNPQDVGAIQSVMWLSAIQHTGQDTSAGGSGPTQLDPVTFMGQETDNRVDGPSPAAPPLYHPRITSIQTETGESIAVTYRAPECSRTSNHMPPSPDSDTMACYQAYWSPPGAKPIADWFQKTLVSQITDNDTTKAGSPQKVTNYTYDGPAWHRDDSDLTDDQYRTWDQFRGFRTITITSGKAPDPITKSVTTYLQGMDGDYKADGTTRSVQVGTTLSQAPTNEPLTTDSDWLAGTALETDTYTQDGGTITAKTIADPSTLTSEVSSPRTAYTTDTSSTRPPLSTLPDLTARRIKTAGSRSVGLMSDGKTWRTTQTSTTYDDSGRPWTIDAKGDLSVPAQETCTTTTYATPPSSNPMMASYPARVLRVSGPCSTTPSTSTTLSDERLFYDGDGTITNPGQPGVIGQTGTTVGNTSAVQQLASYDASGNPVYRTMQAVTHDQYGRAIDTASLAGTSAKTAYLPDHGILPTSVMSTNALGWTQTTTLDPARSLALKSLDANNRVTAATYDALGRHTQVWTPGRDQATQTPDKTFSYAIHGTRPTPTTAPDPSSVTTQTLRDDGSYNTAVTIYDGYLQARQTQTTTADNSVGRLVSSTWYDSHGWATTSIPTWSDTITAPGSTLFVEAENSVPSETKTVFDGLGRVTASQLYSSASLLWQSTTNYPGVDEVDTTPPPGASATSTFTNALGQTTSSVVHGGTGIGDVTTRYTYTPDGKPATTVDNAGNTWTYTYNLLGQQTAQTDPDSGNSSTTYDQLGRIATTTDGRNQTLSFTYDILSRKTGEYSGTNTTDATKQLTGYTYDTLAKGYPTSATRYIGGSGTGSSAYTQAVTGYNTAYQPTGSTVTIPAAETKLANTYTVGATYSPTVGLLSNTNYNADGGLAAESVGYGYDLQGLQVSSGSGRFTHYLDAAYYSPLGQIEQSTYGNAGSQLSTAQTWDAATGRLTKNSVRLQTATANPIDYTTYGYDPAGNLTSVTDAQSSGGTDLTTDNQCFTYDGLDRLTTAWTDTKGTTAPTAGQLSHCTTPAPTPATIGGPTPYWQSWQYDLLGDRTQQVQHDITGNTSKDSTQTSSYRGSGTTAAPQPNTLSSVTSTTPATGTVTQTPSYDSAGNTTSRATKTTIVSSGGTCVDGYNANKTPGTQVYVYTCNQSNPQQWSYQTSTLQLYGKCAAIVGNQTSGNPIQLAACAVSNPQTWQIRPDGTIYNPAANLCLDTANGTTVSGTGLVASTCKAAPSQKWTTNNTAAAPGASQTLTYDAEGRTATVTTTQGTGVSQHTDYLYDASGGLLIQHGPTSTVLYLFGGAEQLTLNTTTSPTTVSGLRYYHNPDGTVIVRSSTGTLTYQPTNPQHTSGLQVDAGTMAVTRRSFDPYGNPRGTAPTAWADNHGYLGQPTDTTTGLNLLGARNYDATLGRFLSTDPILEAGDPNQMGGYTYAANNPTTGSDPNGLQNEANQGGDDAYKGPNNVGNIDNVYGGLDTGDDGNGGGDSGPTCHGGGKFTCDVQDAHAMVGSSPKGGFSFSKAFAAVGDALIGWINTINPAARLANAASGALNRAGAPAPQPVTTSDHPFADTFHVDRNSNGYKAAYVVTTLATLATGADGAVDIVADVGRFIKAGTTESGSLGSSVKTVIQGLKSDSEIVTSTSSIDHDLPGNEGCSFSSDTPVLMGDGSSKAIGQIHVGDQVEAADPASGKNTGQRTVTATWTNHDTDLLDLKIKLEDGSTATIHTTDNHPFWDDSTHEWVAAGRLPIGHALVTAAGGHVVVLAEQPVPGAADMHNLTVNQLHTYYVLAGTTPVLVHNSNCQFWSPTDYNGQRIYQRDDLVNPDYFSPADKYGRGNLKRMQQGLAPMGPDDKPLNLHHMLQTQDGPIAEVTHSMHFGNYNQLHWKAGTKIPSGIDRDAFNAWKSQYWKDRAAGFGE